MAADLRHPLIPGASRPVPEPTLRRLPLYHRLLKEIQEQGMESISCTRIGQDLGLDPTQVRKDIEVTGIVGRPRVGYAVIDLVQALERFLGFHNTNEAFLVGAGSLGAALLGYGKFEECGLRILAAFDIDRRKVGRKIHGKPVYDLETLPDLMSRMHIQIGIITVPALAAQEVADLMIAGGVRAIWNFSPTHLRVPDHIILHNEDLYCSLAALSQKLAGVLSHEVTKGVIRDVAG